MPIIKENSVSIEDETYLQALTAEPKMTMDEVGADIEEHGHVPVTEATSTKDPFTAKGAMSYALDDLEDAGTSLNSPTDDFRDETKGEVEGLEPIIQQDKAVQVKDSLAEALDAITMDGAEEIEEKSPIGKDPIPDYTNYSEETGSHISYKAPDIPPSMGGDKDKPDENGLVYVTATFTVDPDKYISNNYRPASAGNAPNASDVLKKASGAMKTTIASQNEEAALSDLGTPDAKDAANAPDEPSAQQEKDAAKAADKEQAKRQDETREEKNATDSSPESIVLDYATFIDGSSFICFDEVSDIDYSKIAMDAGPKKIPTKKDCKTTFAQCRAKNPLFCRFHGPKLLEADIRIAIKAYVGAGCVVSVTKDKGAGKFTFRLTVGCPPSKKAKVQKVVDMYMTQQPGITSAQTEMKQIEEKGGKAALTQEFDMDILKADEPPKNGKDDNLAGAAQEMTNEYKESGKVMPVVKETPNKIVKAANKESQPGSEEEVEETTVEEVPEGNGGRESQVEHSGNGIDMALHGHIDEITSPDNKDVTLEDIGKAYDALQKEFVSLGGGSLYNAFEYAVDSILDPSGVNAIQDFYKAKFEKNVEGLKKSLQLLKKGVEAYADIPDSDEDSDAGAGNGSSEEKEKSLAVNARADYEGYEEDDKEALLQHLNKVLSGEGFPEDVDEIPEGKPYSRRVCSAQWLDAVDSIKDKVPSLVKALTAIKDSPKKDEKAIGGETTVLPAPNAASKKEETASTAPEEKKISNPIVEKAKASLGTLTDTMKTEGLEEDDHLSAFAYGANYFIEKAEASAKAIEDLDNALAAAKEDDSASPTNNELKKAIIEKAKVDEEKFFYENIGLAEQQTAFLKEALDKALMAKEDEEKKAVADKVEETVKHLAKSIYGGDRPPQGVDSVPDYLDYLVDEVNAIGKTTPAYNSYVGSEKDKAVQEAYAKAASLSNEFDAKIMLFKDVMDDGNMADSKQLEEEIKQMGRELSAAFSGLKKACDSAKDYLNAEEELQKKKDALAKGNGEGSSEEKVTKEDLEDFFDEKLSVSEATGEESLEIWMELANKGTIHGKSPKTYFETVGGWLQGLMEKKGADHPVTKALVKAGLNLPKSMEKVMAKEKKQAESPAQSKSLMSDEENKAIGEVVRFDKMITSLNLPGINDAGSKLVTEIPSSATSPTDLKVGYHGKYSLSKVISLMNNGLSGSGYQVEENPNEENNIKVVKAQPNLKKDNHPLTDEEKNAKIAAMSPKQKMSVAIQYLKKHIASNPHNKKELEEKLKKAEALFAKL